MKKQIFVLHGGEVFNTYQQYIKFLQDSDVDISKNKKKKWKKELPNTLGRGYEVIMPEMPCPWNAKYKEWKIWFEKHIPFMRSPIVLLGHSLGANFLAKYLSENKLRKRIKAVFLVSAAYGDKVGEYYLDDFKLKKDLSLMTKQCKNVIFYQSEDDPVVPFADLVKYQKYLPDANFRIFKNRGHFTGASFPEIVRDIKKLVIGLMFLALLPLGQAKADGCMIPSDYSDGDIYEPSQTALMVYDQGVEDLYLKVNYEGASNDFVWLVPTPTLPQAQKAPQDIFRELSALTTTAHRVEQTLDKSELARAGNFGTNVIVHSQETIGIYEVSVLSAVATDGLFDWLNNNGYKIKEEVKETLDWYVAKEWYFTALRIKPEAKITQLISEFKKIDSTVSADNVVEKISQYFIKAIKELNNDNFIVAVQMLTIVDSDIERVLSKKMGNKDEFLEVATEKIKEYTSKDWDDDQEELVEFIEDGIETSHLSNINKYSNYIEPIKISFKSDNIVYPLKISQISTRGPQNPNESAKTNEVLLYVLADKQVMAPGFLGEYGEMINMAKLTAAENDLYTEDLDSLKAIISDNEYFLTKMRRDFARLEMDEDLYLLDYDKDAEMRDSSFLIRDEKRISDVKQMQMSLELYFNDNNKYCEQTSALSKATSSYGGNYYMPVVPVNPLPGGMDYDYQVLNNGAEYELRFKLEAGDSRYGSGLCVASNSGIKCADEYKELLRSLAQEYQSNKAYVNVNIHGQGSVLADRLKGKIVIKVEDEGKAYYINPSTKHSYYLGRPADAFQVMREQGVGISNENLNKIPVAEGSLSGPDSDSDGLSDLFEDAIGTDKNQIDSDGDGYDDKKEIKNGFNPQGQGYLNYDDNFSQQQAGRIFLQVEAAGEAWYLNPEDGQRYFLGRPADAFQVMRNLGLGISNQDFADL